MISIIIPIYNQAKKLTFTLNSILKQTYTDYEVIIVNDGSKDNPESVFMEFFKKNDIKNQYYFINHRENKGAPAARNTGFEKARGEYLFFCDADAILKPDCLRMMYQILKDRSDAAYVYSSFKWGKKKFNVGEYDPEKLKRGPYIHTMSLIKRKSYPSTGWDEKIKKLQDWDLWLTMLEQNQTGVWINQILFTVQPGGHISSWLPAAAYRWLPFLGAVKRYKRAVKIVKEKHGL
jgi:glycosyltransferase involved in cell wall biosynthesis